MRKSALLTLALALLLWMNSAQARQNFVSEELENDAIRLEQNICKDLGVLGTRAMPWLRFAVAQIEQRDRACQSSVRHPAPGSSKALHQA